MVKKYNDIILNIFLKWLLHSLSQINLLLNFSSFFEKLNTNRVSNHNNKILKKINFWEA